MILGLIASAFITASSLAEVVGHELVNHAAWTNGAKRGFAITNARWDSSGINIQFETDWNPPYLVALFVAEDVFMSDFRRPLKRQTTMMKAARFTGLPFLKKNIFAVVGTPDSMAKGPDMTQEEIAAYERKIATEKPDNQGYEDPFDEQVMMNGTTPCYLIGDYTWVRFFRTYDAFEFRNKPGMYPDYFNTVVTNYYNEKFVETYYVDVAITGMTARSIYELPRFEETHVSIFTNQSVNRLAFDVIEKQTLWQVEGLPPYTYFVSNVIYKTVGGPFEVPAIGSTNVWRESEWRLIPEVPMYERNDCTGTRFVHFEDTDTDFLCFAYSARTNRSEEVAIRRPIKAPKGSLFMDWLGRLNFTNKANRAWFDMY